MAARHFGLLVRSFLVLVIVRIALYVTSYQRISKHVRVKGSGANACRPVYLIVWAVEHASKVVPRANCLTRALALQYLLGRYGHASMMRVGVSQSSGGSFEAHAWVLHDHTVIIGGTPEEISRYTPIVDLAAEAQ